MMQFARSLCMVGLCSLLLLLVGCQPGDERLCEIEGTLRYKGKPIPRVQISFEPDDLTAKSTSMGMSDDSGRFVMMIGSTPGVFKGKVKVYCDDPVAAVGSKMEVPPEVESDYRALVKKYGHGKSKHELTIEKTDKKLDLNLE
ncbi:hypothetical protein NA78x_000478 [Anatilimnocola sp. NA78]|uniref:hypothetical protein n=1 Tax=Anatilimnocola sp. NA78 TaxID=3415683 RepID=UPI003CE4D294